VGTIGPGPKIISVASGKGGVGKTNVTLNLAWALARNGHRVCIFDADLGLSNVDILLGISTGQTLEHVLFEGVPLERVIVTVGPGVDLVPGSSGVARMAELTRAMRLRMVREFTALSRYDYVLVDNSPGISPQVLSLCLAAQELLLVVNPEATSITDAYVLLKVLRERGLCWSPHLLINRAPSALVARRVFERIQSTAQKYLSQDCRYLGFLPEDAAVGRAGAWQKPVLEAYPASGFAAAITAAAARLEAVAVAGRHRAVDAAAFWDETVRHFQQTAPLPVSNLAPKAADAPLPEELNKLELELKGIRALFTRLDFPGAPDALVRIAQAGQRRISAIEDVIGRFGPPGSEPRQPAAPAAASAAPPGQQQARVVLVHCGSRDMEELVADILLEMGLAPRLSRRGGGRIDTLQTLSGGAKLSLCVLSASEPSPGLASFLGTLGETPALLLDGSFGRSRKLWQAYPSVRAVLPVPFAVPEFIAEVSTLLQNGLPQPQ
jgi:flagellar biosynthesis protein FlhG